MKQYRRTKQKRLDLLSVREYTISERNEQRRDSCRKVKKATLLNHTESDGERCDHSSGSGTQNRRQEIQHQQSDAQETCGELRLLAEDCGKHRSGRGNEGPKKIGDAA